MRMILTLALLACTGEPSGDDSKPDDSTARVDSEQCETWQALEDFIATYPDSFCDIHEGCEGSTYEDRAFCMQFTTAYAQCITFDPCRTAACVEALQAVEACGEYPPECDAAFIGEDRC